MRLAATVAELVRIRLALQLGMDMVEAGLSAGPARSKAKNDPALALSALNLDAAALASTPSPAQ